MITAVVFFCITTMVASAPSDIRPVVNTDASDQSPRMQANVEPDVLTSVNIPSQINDDKLKYKRMLQAEHGGFQSGYLPVSPFALPPTYSALPSGFNYFPKSHLPFSYPVYYQDKYGFGGNYEIKSDPTDLQNAFEDELRTVSSSASSTTTPATPTNPMAPFFNTLIAINNVNILKLLLANKAMLIMG